VNCSHPCPAWLPAWPRRTVRTVLRRIRVRQRSRPGKRQVGRLRHGVPISGRIRL
jgi:hypothetical protein